MLILPNHNVKCKNKFNFFLFLYIVICICNEQIGSYETRKDANDVGDFVSDVLNKLLNSGCIKDYTVTVCGDNPQ